MENAKLIESIKEECAKQGFTNLEILSISGGSGIYYIDLKYDWVYKNEVNKMDTTWIGLARTGGNYSFEY